jgi:hypothetical protein
LSWSAIVGSQYLLNLVPAADGLYQQRGREKAAMSRNSIFRKSSAYEQATNERRKSVEEFADELAPSSRRRSPFKTPKRSERNQPKAVAMGPLDPFEFPLRREDEENRYVMLS